uniref:Uncharacterized protein n=1 Tax=Candidatus Kentrum sp. LPFa TaxID=2126335 RepID=A0A450VVC3_9GAMM|nr:MAG: hypothetical protein BECKLPF1236A_GA0070988_100208 [Candidatus Kentron sp. LPFa]VFK25839.1 MAG: hypothetical protein BECKLPF1236C_GA0070990_100269 [Candidatus Kentron sp. LPFa]
MSLSIVPTGSETERHTFKTDATRFRSAAFAPLSLSVERGMRWQYDRNTKTNIVTPLAGASPIFDQTNELVSTLKPLNDNGAGFSWEQAIPVFSSKHNPMSGRNPTTRFRVSPFISTPSAGRIRVLTYDSKPFSFVTADGGQAKIAFKGAAVVDQAWKKIFFSVFRYSGDVTEPNGKMTPVKGQNRLVRVHDITGEPIIALDEISELGTYIRQGFGPLTEGLVSPDVSRNIPMPVWLKDVYQVATVSQALAATTAEQRTNPGFLAIIAGSIAIDSTYTFVRNLAVDITLVASGKKELRDALIRSLMIISTKPMGC